MHYLALVLQVVVKKMEKNNLYVCRSNFLVKSVFDFKSYIVFLKKSALFQLYKVEKC